MATRACAVLLTTDKDFAEMIFRQRLATTGVVLMRLSGLSQELKADMVSEAVSAHAPELLQSFAVITPASVRIRGPAR